MYLNTKNLIESIRDIGHQINLKSNTPLVKDLEEVQTFKNKVKKEGASIINLILSVLQLLKKDLLAVVDSIKLVKPWDKGQLSYIVKFGI